MTVTVRAARAGDAAAILAVVDVAFSDDTRDATEELTIVRDTWSWGGGRPGDLLELVADERGTVVGHVMAATGDLEGTAVPGVAPVCVAPTHQRAGIGSALMETLIEQATVRHWPLLLLLGDPGYYGRFGFEPAGPLGIHYAPVGRDNPHFMARRLAGYDEWAPSGRRGEFRYCWEPG